MKNTLLKYLHFALICLIFFISNSTYAQQKVSAEFLSSLEPITLSTGEKLEDGVRGVRYHNNILYITNVWAGIQCVNADDIKNPKEIGKYETEHRPHNIFIADKYGYVSDELGGVTILDISNPKNPVQIGNIETKGDAFWVEANYPYVYVAEEKFGVNVYDITNINDPVRLGGFDTPGWAWYLTIKDNYVFVGDKNGGLQIIDFSDKTNPVRYGQFKNLQNARTVFVDENYAYVANGPNGMAILDVSNPKFPALVSTYETNGYIFDLFKAGKNIYLADEINRRVDILNIADVKNPVLQGFYKAEGKVYSVWKKDVYLFVAADDKILLLRHNNPPTLAGIENQNIKELQNLNIIPDALDPDGDPIFFEASNLPEGALFDSLTGAITWVPTYEQSGLYKDITIKVIEKTETKLSATKSFDVTVSHVNRLPVMAQVGDTLISENTTLSVTLKEGSDPDKEDKGKLAYKAENLPDGAVFDELTRQFSWAPTFEQSGVYTVDFVINDPVGGTDRDASTITILHVDRNPEIVAVENQIVNENELLSIKVEGSDPDKEDQNAISFEAKNLPDNATFDAATQMYTWTPSYDQSGEYTDILLIMTAGKLSDSTKFNVSVTHTNRSPKLEKIVDQVIDENKTLTFSVSGSDADIEDEGKLTYSTNNLPDGSKFNPDSMNFSWTPTYEQSKEYDNLVFIVTDPTGLSDSQFVKVSVNHINRTPVMEEIPPYSGGENVLITFKVTGSDPDVEDVDKLVYEAQTLPEGANFTDQTFSWTPTYDQSGEYSVTFNLSDGQLNDSKIVPFTVNHVNRPPKIDSLAAQITDEAKQIQFNITASDPDVEDAGKFTLSSTGLPEGAIFDPTTAAFNWTPTFEQSGKYDITFTNTDPAGLTNTLTLPLTVNHINRTPVFNPLQAQIVEENSPLSFVVPIGEDPDKEDAEKLIYVAKDLPEGATFDPATMTLAFAPTFEQSGEYTTTISLTDGEFTVEQPVKLTVSHVNRSPVMDALEPKSVDENSQLQFTLVSNDPDKEDEGKTTLISTELPQGAAFDNNTGSFTWTPTYEQSGDYTITFTITDPAGLNAAQTVSITVAHVNREPKIKEVPQQTVAENVPISINFEATDEDKEDEGKLKFSGSTIPNGATLDELTGSFAWTPNFLQAGNHKFDVKVTDSGELFTAQSIEIVVQNINRSPVINPIEDKTANENSALAFSITGSDEDTDNELKYSLSDIPDGAEFDEKSGSFSWTPGFEQAGDYNITATLDDGESQVTTNFKITVTNVNRKPEIEKGGSATITVGETAQLSFSASDPDDDNITFSSDNLPEGSSLNASGDFTWTPGENQVGSFVFIVVASDGTDSDQTSASVTVQAKPLPPPAPPKSEE